MKFELVLFDLDGTLVDSTHDIRTALAHALTAVPPGDAAADERVLGSAGLGLPLDEFFAIARAAPHPHGTLEGRARFVDAYRSFYHANLLVNTRPFPGVVETLTELAPLRRRGLRTAVATTKKTDTARRVIEGLGLVDHFDAVLGTDGIPHKPAPDLLLLAARTLDRDPRRGLMIGDTDRDLLAGRAAGMKTCAVGWGVCDRGALLAHEPDYMIDEFVELLTIVA